MELLSAARHYACRHNPYRSVRSGFKKFSGISRWALQRPNSDLLDTSETYDMLLSLYPTASRLVGYRTSSRISFEQSPGLFFSTGLGDAELCEG